MQKINVYSLCPVSLHAHLFRVTLTIPRPAPEGQQLCMPAWIPGSYMIRDFAKNIISIKALCEGQPVALSKLDKQTWKVAPVSAPLVVEYEVYAWDLSVRGAYLDTTRGFFNGTSVFLQVVGQEDMPSRVYIQKPAGKAYRSWKLATSMQPAAVDQWGFGSYEADSYADLIDHPVEMGHFQELEFEVDAVPHRMSISGKCQFDAERLSGDLQRICSHHALFFGELPVTSYLFLVLVTGDGYGGLEHMDSTSLLCKRDDLPPRGMQAITEDYMKFLGLCSHEYFHLWHVKRIRPEVFKQADLSREVYTELLWAFEGITSYYDDLALVRSGCIEPKKYLGLLAQTITRVMRSSGRRKQTLAESSFDAWTRFYQQDENAPNAIISYYSKGALVALGLDMQLRDSSREQRSLDHFMRRLWEDYGKQDKGVTAPELERLASEVAGEDLSAFFARTVHDTEELPLEEWLASVGVGYQLRPARNQEDWGGVRGEPEPVEPKPALGARYRQQGDLVELVQVFDGGSAQEAGLSAGDRLIAIDGLQVSAKNLDRLMGRFEPGEEVPVHAFRRDELMTFSLPIQPAPRDTCDLWFLPEAQCTPAQLARRRSWLNEQ
ncbi:M61 family metallopeptidase [Thiolapillus sp.]